MRLVCCSDPLLRASPVASPLKTDPSAILETSDEYRTGVGKRFSALAAQRKDDPSKLRGAVVVDAFAGIGTGIVVLKRLGIKMQKVGPAF